MAFNDMITKAQTYFPSLQIKYKDQSTFMRWLGKLMFFNPDFMTEYVSTIGHTVYFPSQDYVQNNPQDANTVFIHECTHMYDENRVGSVWYTLSYLFPLILMPVFLVLILVLSGKWLALLALLWLAPLPAPWRAHFERRAYFVQMYVDYVMYKDDPAADGALFNSWFKDGSYYWMWPFGLDQEFAQEAVNVKAGKSTMMTESPLNTMVNDLVTAAQL